MTNLNLKENVNNKKGITLVALIVSIIVLLILATVSINLVINNGIIEKTEEATIRTEIQQYNEELKLAIAEDTMNNFGLRDKFNAATYADIKEIIPSFNIKYENILVIEDDKLTYKGKDRESYLRAIDIGLVPEDELLDDEILEELQPFITEWTVAAGDTITLPIGGTCDFTVDYGDGTGDFKVTSSDDEDRIHTYTNAGTYTVTIKGTCETYAFWTYTSSRDKITKIVQWGNIGVKEINFHTCTNLTGPIPIPSKNSFKNVTTMGAIFFSCSNLTGAIPESLFKNCTEVTTFTYAFSRCSKLTGNIPERLFKDCAKVTNFSYTFEKCINLTGSIPEQLFKNCTEVSTFNSTFSNCSKLTGNIPENLFVNCTKVNDFGQTFYQCSKLTGSITENLFANCTNTNSFWGTFYGCNGLTGNAPDLWNRTNNPDGSYCFGTCTNLSNYNSIPDGWK